MLLSFFVCGKSPHNKKTGIYMTEQKMTVPLWEEKGRKKLW